MILSESDSVPGPTLAAARGSAGAYDTAGASAAPDDALAVNAPGAGTLVVDALALTRAARQPLLGLTPLARLAFAGVQAFAGEVVLVVSPADTRQALALAGDSRARRRVRVVTLEGRPQSPEAWRAALAETSAGHGSLLVTPASVVVNAAALAALALPQAAGSPGEAIAERLPDPRTRVDRPRDNRPRDDRACGAPWQLRPSGTRHAIAQPAVGVYQPIASQADRRRARRALLYSLVKPNEDGLLARTVHRRLSLPTTALLTRTPVTPNLVTVFVTLIGLAGAGLFLLAWPAPLVGALLLIASSIFDGVDGELARVTYRSSRLGGWLDFLGDNLVHLALFGAITAAAVRAEPGGPWLWLGASTLVSVALTVGLVSVLTLRRDQGRFTSLLGRGGGRPGAEPLRRVLDGLARRDFLYLVLVLAAFERSAWFLWLSGMGSPVFLLVLVGMLVAAGFQRRRAVAPGAQCAATQALAAAGPSHRSQLAPAAGGPAAARAHMHPSA